MDGGSLADILRLRKRIPEPLLSSMFQKLLHVSMQIHPHPATFKQKLMQYIVILTLVSVFTMEGTELLAWSQVSSTQRHKTCQFAYQSQGRAKDNRLRNKCWVGEFYGNGW